MTVVLRKAKFATLNKNDTLARYREEVAAGRYEEEDCSVTETIVLTSEAWDAFMDNLLTDNPLIAGKGGHQSTWEAPEGVTSFLELTDAQRTAWRAGAYREVVAITAPDREEVFVDPQGYDYARYVGLPS